jgi:hypothetical protein
MHCTVRCSLCITLPHITATVPMVLLNAVLQVDAVLLQPTYRQHDNVMH